MAADINQITLSGRLTGDVEVKSFENSTLLTGSIASNRSVKKNDEWKEEASFFQFNFWLKSEKQVNYFVGALKKGAQVFIQGEMLQERWEKDGKKNSRHVINVQKMIPAYSKTGNNSDGGSASNNGGAVPDYNGSEFPEDIPF